MAAVQADLPSSSLNVIQPVFEAGSDEFTFYFRWLLFLKVPLGESTRKFFFLMSL